MSEKALPFTQRFGATFSVSPASSSASTAIDKDADSVRIINTGANIAYVRFGTSVNGTITATTGDIAVPNGSDLIYGKSIDYNTVAYISVSGTTLLISPGTGGLGGGYLPAASGGGGGGAVTIADGADSNAGTTTDAAVAAGAAGTLSAKVRRLTTDVGAIAAATPPTSTVNAANSSATVLGIGGVFTGTAVSILPYTSVTVVAFSDQASATNGLSIQQSSDGTNWDVADTYTVSASSAKNIGVLPVQQQFRVVYTNGAVAQGSFRLQTILHQYGQHGSSVKPVDAMSIENDMEQQISIQMLFNGVTMDMWRGSIANGALVDVSRIVPGVTATSLGKAEDAAAASGDTGVFMLGVRRDAPTISASATGDYNELAVDQYGSALIRSYEKQAKTYSCALNVAAAAAATDIATITGSATTTVFITKVIISGIQTTAGLNDILLVKRSTADTAGTSTAGTALPHDSADAAASATVLAYTANPTLGTTVASLRRNYQPIGGVTSVVNPVVTYDFGDKGRPLVLRGIAQVLAVNLNGATLTGGTFDITFEWFEI